MARSFNGSGNKIITTALTTTQVNNVTMAGWVNPVTVTGTRCVFYNGNSAANGCGWFSTAAGLGNDGKISAFCGAGSLGLFTVALSSGVWTPVVITTDNSTNVIFSLYTFGIFRESKGTAASFLTPTTSAHIGVDSATSYYSGSLADIAMWNVVLTANEIAALAAGMRPYMIRPVSLVGYWPLDGLVSPEPDLSGKANNGTVTGATFDNGGPVTMFTPRWPLNSMIPPIIQLTQTHFRFRTDTNAVDATPTWGANEDAA